MSHCFSCQKELNVEGQIGRRDECPSCGADLHCCRNCEFYDPQAYNECREPVADRVKEKDRSNFCDWFKLGDHKAQEEADKVAEAKRKLAELFKKREL